MNPYKKTFIDVALQAQALKFGEFTLKSGRVSPYFFNAGLMYTGKALAELGRAYAHTLNQTDTCFDVLFGPAYKGIPIVSATAIALNDSLNQDIPYCYNRKEAKQHGEGGQLVGADLKDKKIAILDDVITAGTAIREALHLIEQNGASPAIIVIGLDRQERGQGKYSAIDELQQQTQIQVMSIIKLDDIIQYVEQSGQHEQMTALINYRKEYGVASE